MRGCFVPTILLLIGGYVAWSGFTVGGREGFVRLMASVVICLFAVASAGMSEDIERK